MRVDDPTAEDIARGHQGRGEVQASVEPKTHGAAQRKGQEIIDANAGPKILCTSYDEINFHEAGEVPLGACCEVFPEGKDDVPIEIMFANYEKETTTQHMKLIWLLVRPRCLFPGARL